VVLVYLAALVPAVAMAAAQPVWSRVDEAQHADVLAQYAHGDFPIEGVTTLRPDIVAVDEATGVYRWNVPGTGPVPAETDTQAFVPPPQSASPAAKRAWTARHLWGFSYEAMQPPLYYLLAEPAWWLGARFGGTFGAIHAARLFSALVAACLAPLVYLLGLVIRPGAQRMPLLAAGFAALLPGYVLNTTQITNDGLAAVLGAALTVVAVKGARDGWSRSLAALCGLLLGLAVLTKLTAVGLLPLVAAAFLWPGARPLRMRLMAGAIAASVAALLVAPWLAFNLHAYGQPLPSQATRTLLGSMFAPPAATANYVIGSARNAFGQFVTGEPLNVVPLSRPLHWLEGALAVLAAAGLLLSRRRLRLEYLLILGVASDFIWVLMTPFLSGVGGLMPGRYLYPAAAAVFVLVAAGCEALPSLVARTSATIASGVAMLVLALLASGHFGPVAHHQALSPQTPGVAVNAYADADGLGVVVDRVEMQDGGHTVWVHVTVTDHAPLPADFTPMPEAHTAPASPLYGDYLRSTAFPERLEPGESRSGWLRYTRVSTSPVMQIELVYRNVSTDGFASIQTLSLVVTP
jgi:hypothetical protein